MQDHANIHTYTPTYMRKKKKKKYRPFEKTAVTLEFLLITSFTIIGYRIESSDGWWYAGCVLNLQ